MFGFFKKKQPKPTAKPELTVPELSVKEQALAQMRKTREDLGDETIQRWAAKIRFDDLKAQIQKDIEGDEDKRDRILDELRWGMDQDRKL